MKIEKHGGKRQTGGGSWWELFDRPGVVFVERELRRRYDRGWGCEARPGG